MGLKTRATTQVVAEDAMAGYVEQQSTSQTASSQEMTIAQPPMSLNNGLQTSIGIAPQDDMLSTLLQAPFRDSYMHDSQTFDMLAPESFYDISLFQNTSNLADPLLQVRSLLRENSCFN